MVGSIEVGRALRPESHAVPVFETPMVEIERLSLWYGTKLALKDVSMAMPKHRVTAYIGPSGCGKSTLLLLLIVVLLNLFAIALRNRLRRMYATSAV